MTKILEYHRPAALDEALRLLARTEVRTIPLAGGTALNRPAGESAAVVDLQALGLNKLEKQGSSLSLGAALTLQALLDSGEAPAALAETIRLEAGYNLRQTATVAGTLVAADGRSPFTTALLALDATLEVQQANAPVEWLGMGELLPLRTERLAGKLITRVTLPLNAQLVYESVSRSPADLPIVCAALARWPSGRVRLALGGFGAAPVLALDGPEAGGIEVAARDACSRAGDQWASVEYRQGVAATLAKRALLALTGA
jgi:CO/xanthine dehydrogenase FAD-binding subunit